MGADSGIIMEHKLVQCKYKTNKCITGGYFNSEGICEWKRKLCVTCYVDDDDEVKIRLQTNSLPNHCVDTITIKEQNFDYEVVFNKPMDTAVMVNNPSTQADVDKLICPIWTKWERQWEKTLKIVEYGQDESKRSMVIALNGVSFQ